MTGEELLGLRSDYNRLAEALFGEINSLRRELALRDARLERAREALERISINDEPCTLTDSDCAMHMARAALQELEAAPPPGLLDEFVRRKSAETFHTAAPFEGEKP